jgi:hypothetical protein
MTLLLAHHLLFLFFLPALFFVRLSTYKDDGRLTDSITRVSSEVSFGRRLGVCPLDVRRKKDIGRKEEGIRRNENGV